MSNIKKALSELRGVLGGYGFARTEAASAPADSRTAQAAFLDSQKRDIELGLYGALDSAEVEDDFSISTDTGGDGSSSWSVDGSATVSFEFPLLEFVDDTALEITADDLDAAFKRWDVAGKPVMVGGDASGKRWKMDSSSKRAYRFTITGGPAKSGDDRPFKFSQVIGSDDIDIEDHDPSADYDDEHVDDRYDPNEARSPMATRTMSSGRYIGQVLGNVISDIEKGHHEDAVTLLRKLKTDLEKAGTEVVELWGEGK